MRLLCLIPAKGASTRLPRKNILELNGHPLVAHCIAKAHKSGVFETVCVSTEDNEVADVARSYGADVPFLRPERLSVDPATIIDVMLHSLEYYKSQQQIYTHVIVLLPTSPLLLTQDITNAIEQYKQNDVPTLLSVTPTDFPPYNTWSIEQDANHLRPAFPDSPYKYSKSTECPPTYRSNGAILITRVDLLLKDLTYRNQPIMPYIMPLERSLDIDVDYEYQFAKFLYLNKDVYRQQEWFL